MLIQTRPEIKVEVTAETLRSLLKVIPDGTILEVDISSFIKREEDEPDE